MWMIKTNGCNVEHIELGDASIRGLSSVFTQTMREILSNITGWHFNDTLFAGYLLNVQAMTLTQTFELLTYDVDFIPSSGQHPLWEPGWFKLIQDIKANGIV